MLSKILGGNIWFDEHITVLMSQQPVKEILYLSQFDTNMGTFYILLRPLILLFGNSFTVYRIIIALFAFFGLVTLYFISKSLKKDNFFVLSVVAVTFLSPYFDFITKEIRVYSLLFFIHTLVLLALLNCVVLKAKPSKLNYLSYLLINLFGISLHLTYLWYFVILNLYLVLVAFLDSSRREELLKKYLLIPNLLVLSFIFILNFLNIPTIFPQVRNILDIHTVHPPTALKSPIQVVFEAIPDLYFMDALFYEGFALVVLCLLGLYHVYKNFDKSFFSLFLVSLLSPIFLLTVGNVRAYQSYKYISFAFPFIALLIGFGIYQIIEFLKLREVIDNALNKIKKILNKRLVLVIFITMVLFTSFKLFQLYLYRDFKFPHCYNNVFKQIENPEALVLVSPPWEHMTFQIYNTNKNPILGVHTIHKPLGENLSLKEVLDHNWLPTVTVGTVDNLTNYIDGYSEVFYINSAPYIGDPNLLAVKWLSSRFKDVQSYKMPCSGYQDAILMRFN
jgi:hypothetical protein